MSRQVATPGTVHTRQFGPSHTPTYDVAITHFSGCVFTHPLSEREVALIARHPLRGTSVEIPSRLAAESALGNRRAPRSAISVAISTGQSRIRPTHQRTR